jgi:hypothetical protein
VAGVGKQDNDVLHCGMPSHLPQNEILSETHDALYGRIKKAGICE